MIYGQRDPRWADENLGFSNSKIGGWGCTITCLAMLAGLTPSEVNQRMKDVGGFANGNLVLWGKINQAIPWLNFQARRYSLNWDELNGAIHNFNACLVEVDFDNNIRTNGKHWVLYLRDDQMADPWTGQVDSRERYGIVTGYSIIEAKANMIPLSERAIAVIDKMGNETLENMFVDGDPITGTQLMTLPRTEIDIYITLQAQARDLTAKVADLTAKLKAATANAANTSKIKELTDALKTANDKRTATTQRLKVIYGLMKTAVTNT